VSGYIKTLNVARQARTARLAAEALDRAKFLAQAKGDKGEKGDKGDTGATGPMPDHQWRGSELRFQKPKGWGQWVDLRGPSGPVGLPGADGTPGDTASLPAKTLTYSAGVLSEVLLFADAGKTVLAERRTMIYDAGRLVEIQYRDAADALIKAKNLSYAANGSLESVVTA